MSLPKIDNTITGYRFAWEAEQITIEVSRIRQNKTSTAGEIIISTSAPGFKAPHITQQRFSFTNKDDRDKLAKSLSQKIQIDWESILEQLCVYCLREIRRGEPVVELGGPEREKQPPIYLVDPLVIKNYPNVLFGEPGSAKTTTALALVLLVSLSWQDNPLYLPVYAGKGARVLWLDWETDEDTIGWQLQCLTKGTDTFCTLNYRHCSLPLAADLEQIKQCVDEYEADVVVVDSIGLACGGDLNSPEPVLNYFTALRQLRRTSINLAHTSKNTEGKKSMFGSVFFEAQARNVWEIVKSGEPGDSSINVGLFHRKPPPFSKLHQPLGFQFDFTEDTTTVIPHDPKSVEELVKRMGTNQRILAILKQGSLSPQEIIDSLEITRSNAYLAIKRLSDKELIIKLSDGKWGLKCGG